MFPQRSRFKADTGSKTYPLGEPSDLASSRAMALLALSHTPLEHRVYMSMFAETASHGNGWTPFTLRQLVTRTGVRGTGSLRRALEGLVTKLSIERGNNGNGDGQRLYRVHHPEEILARRAAVGLEPYPSHINGREGNQYFERAIQRVAANGNLSRREAQVALCCVEGLTNSQIGNRLSVSEQTIKFHLRHVFLKFGVKRRAELIARLLL